MDWSYYPAGRRVADVLDPATGKLRFPWGFLVHTTGGGVPEKAAKTGRPAVDIALDIYRKSQSGFLHPYRWGGPTYVCDYDGAVYQLSPDEVMTAHAGGSDRETYLSGEWVSKCSRATVEAWRRQWPGYQSPQHLYPSKTANADYVGIELIPIAPGAPAEPMAPGLRFTRAQHEACVALGRWLANRHAWPAGWARTPRLLGHEDVQPLVRHDRGGGWDPGYLRERPYFDFEFVRSALS